MALRSINLVPPGILARLHYVRHIWFWIIVLVVLLVPIFTYHFYQVNVVFAQKASLQTLRSIDKDIKAKVLEIHTVKQAIEKLNRQLSDIETVIGDQSYANILYTLSGSMNSKTWLASLDIHSDKTGAHLLLNGYAVSNDALGEMLNKLSREPLFENVVLNYVKEPQLEKNEDSKRIHRIEFEMACHTASQSSEEK